MLVLYMGKTKVVYTPFPKAQRQLVFPSTSMQCSEITGEKKRRERKIFSLAFLHIK